MKFEEKLPTAPIEQNPTSDDASNVKNNDKYDGLTYKDAHTTPEKVYKYRDGLASDLREIRNSDKKLEIGSAKARGYLECLHDQDTRRNKEYDFNEDCYYGTNYGVAKRLHKRDLKNFLPTEPESIKKKFEKFDSMEDRAKFVFELVEREIKVPKEISDLVFNYVKAHFKDENWINKIGHATSWRDSTKGAYGHRNRHFIDDGGTYNSVFLSPVSLFLESTRPLEEVLQIYEEAGTKKALARAAWIAQKNKKISKDMIGKSVEYLMEIYQKHGKSNWVIMSIGKTLMEAGRKEDAAKWFLQHDQREEYFKLAPHIKDIKTLQKNYNEYYTSEKLESIFKIEHYSDRDFAGRYDEYRFEEKEAKIFLGVAKRLGLDDIVDKWTKEFNKSKSQQRDKYGKKI